MAVLGADAVRPERPAGLVEQPRRSLGVVVDALDHVGVVAQDGGGSDGVDYGGVAAEHALDERLPVHRHRYGTAQVGVGEQAVGPGEIPLGDVHQQHLAGRGVDDLQTRLLGEVVHHGARNRRDEVHLTVLERERPRRVVGDEAERDLVEHGRIAPVALVALDHEALLRHVLRDRERAGADDGRVVEGVVAGSQDRVRRVVDLLDEA